MTEAQKNTELKIKEAARKVFQEKGFSGTKTRDIAEAADINLALLNYYFRSKKKLFDIIMTETLQEIFPGAVSILDDEKTSLQEKITLFTEYYLDFLMRNPNMVHFIINAVRENPEEYLSKFGHVQALKNSAFQRQFQAAKEKGEIADINPIHFMLNLIGLIVFPVLAQPMISTMHNVSDAEYEKLLNERKKLIPLWIQSILSVK